MTNICTLFEGDYHYGLGALTNSLYQNGFRGIIWAGYRGDLPSWAAPLLDKAKYKVYNVADDCEIRFISLNTDYHFANYKPHFMLDLWENYCPKTDKLMYFDPDIILKCEWAFINHWADQYVALCEDINSPVFAKDPERLAWAKILSKHHIELPFYLNKYVNSGFVGLSKKNINFLETWKKILEIIHIEVRPLNISFIPQVSGQQYRIPLTRVFYRMDQDAFNATAMLHSENLSITYKKGMDFSSVGYIMSHAIGDKKPWHTKYIRRFLKGYFVPYSHKSYWRNTQYPIKLYSQSKVKLKQLVINLTSFLSRFYLRKI